MKWFCRRSKTKNKKVSCQPSQSPITDRFVNRSSRQKMISIWIRSFQSSYRSKMRRWRKFKQIGKIKNIISFKVISSPSEIYSEYCCRTTNSNKFHLCCTMGRFISPRAHNFMYIRISTIALLTKCRWWLIFQLRLPAKLYIICICTRTGIQRFKKPT